jgi:hypothetical protein
VVVVRAVALAAEVEVVAPASPVDDVAVDVAVALVPGTVVVVEAQTVAISKPRWRAAVESAAPLVVVRTTALAVTGAGAVTVTVTVAVIVVASAATVWITVAAVEMARSRWPAT